MQQTINTNTIPFLFPHALSDCKPPPTLFSLQPGDGYSVVPDSEFVVSRTAYKDNSSQYQLNGKKVSFKEVAALLRGSGIDLDHNRFLILQVSHMAAPDDLVLVGGDRPAVALRPARVVCASLGDECLLIVGNAGLLLIC